MFHKTPGDPSQGSPSPQGYCPGLPLTSPLHSPAFSSSVTQSLSFPASAHSIGFPFVPLFLPLSLFLSLPSLPGPLSLLPSLSLCLGFCLRVSASSCLYPSFSLSLPSWISFSALLQVSTSSFLPAKCLPESPLVPHS